MDNAVAVFFISTRQEWLNPLVAVFSTAFSPRYIIGVAVALALLSLVWPWWGMGGHRGRFVYVAVALVAAQVVTTVLKGCIDRQRPDAAWHLVATHDASFPSGHATVAGALAMAMSLLAAYGWQRWLVWLWAAMMALARLYLGVHWLSDVLAGLFIGAAMAAAVWWVGRRYFSLPPRVVG